MWGIYHRQDSTIGGIEFTNNTTVNSTFGTINGSQSWAMGSYMYYRFVKHSSTSYDIQFSVNGVHWLDISLARNESGFMTPDQIGFYVNFNNSQQSLIAIDWYRVS
jgi:hypothetical protein